MTSAAQTSQTNNIQASMNTDWPSNTDFLRYMAIDDSLADSIPEAGELSFEEPEATELFGEAFFLVDSTSDALGLSFELGTAELFEKLCFSDPAPEAAELSSEEPCPQAQSTDVETQDLPAEDSLLAEEASHDPSDNGVPTRYLVNPNAARPSGLGVPGATATDTDKESQKITDQFQSDHDESTPAPSTAKPELERQAESLIDLTESSESELSPQPASVQKVWVTESLSPQTSSDEIASCVGFTSESSRALDAVSIARKRKRSKVRAHGSAWSSDSSTGQTRVKTPTRRQTRSKTSVQTYARDESLRIERELKHIDEMLQENAQEMQMAKAKEAKMLEENDEEMELVQRKKARILEQSSRERELIQKKKASLTGFKERMLAWDAHDRMVTEEWEHSR